MWRRESSRRRRTVVALFAAAVALGSPAAAQAAVTFDRAFGDSVLPGAPGGFEQCTFAPPGCQGGAQSTAAGGMGDPFGVATDADGRILVTDADNSRVNRYTVAGDGTVAFDRAFGIGVATGSPTDFENCTTTCQAGVSSAAAGGMDAPVGVTVDAQGRILVADRNNNRVDRYTVAAGDGSVAFDRAFGVGVETGNPAGFENCTITCFAGTAAGMPGGMWDPSGVVVDAQGRILVTDGANERIARFTVAANGTVAFDRAFGADVLPGGSAGFENCTSAPPGCQSGDLTGIAGAVSASTGLDVDAQGRIVVASAANNRVDRFTVAPDGTVAFDRAFGTGVLPGGATGFENCTTATGCEAGTSSTVGGGLYTPGGVAVDPTGRIVVAEGNNNRISRFTVAGDGTVTFDRAFGMGVLTGTPTFENCTTSCTGGLQNDGAGGMSIPERIAVDPLGRILVADRGFNRIDRFFPGRTVTVTKALSPAADAGTFNLRVDAVTVRAGASNGQSGSVQVNDGVDVTVSEQAADPAHPLSDYTTTINCGNGPQAGTSLTVNDVTTDVNCTITNTRRPPPPPPFTLTVTGDRCDPVTAPDIEVTANRAASGTLIVSRQNGVGAVRRCPQPQRRPTTAPAFTQLLTKPLTLTTGTQTVTARSRAPRAHGRRAMIRPRRATFRVRLRPGRTRLRVGRIAGAQLRSGRYDLAVDAADSGGQRARDGMRIWLVGSP